MPVPQPQPQHTGDLLEDPDLHQLIKEACPAPDPMEFVSRLRACWQERLPDDASGWPVALTDLSQLLDEVLARKAVWAPQQCQTVLRAAQRIQTAVTQRASARASQPSGGGGGPTAKATSSNGADSSRCTFAAVCVSGEGGGGGRLGFRTRHFVPSKNLLKNIFVGDLFCWKFFFVGKAHNPRGQLFVLGSGKGPAPKHD